jgi:hypothetical protein
LFDGVAGLGSVGVEVLADPDREPRYLLDRVQPRHPRKRVSHVENIPVRVTIRVSARIRVRIGCVVRVRGGICGS